MTRALAWALTRNLSAPVNIHYDRAIEFAGDTDLTDYHSPLGADMVGIGRLLCCGLCQDHDEEAEDGIHETILLLDHFFKMTLTLLEIL